MLLLKLSQFVEVDLSICVSHVLQLLIVAYVAQFASLNIF